MHIPLHSVEEGVGVEKNEPEAIVWYRRAAALNASFALNDLGWCFENSIGIKKNSMVAACYYYLAILLNNEKSINNSQNLIISKVTRVYPLCLHADFDAG